MKKLASVILIIATVISMLSVSNLASYSVAKDDSAYDCVAYATARFREVWGFDLHATGYYNGYAGAQNYYYNASTYGDTISSTPKAGALAVWSSTYPLAKNFGHVAFVESVNGSYVTYSEGGYNDGYNEATRSTSDMTFSWYDSKYGKTFTQTFLGYVYVNGTGLGATVLPDVPNVSISKYVVQSRETFTVSFNAGNAERYWIGFYLNNVLLYDTSAISREVSVSLASEGKYSVVVSAINSIGETAGYTSIVVGDPTEYLPTVPEISVNKNILDLNETLILNFDSKYVEEFWIGFYLEGVLIESITPTSRQYQISFDKLGKYSVVVTAINKFGETYSNLRFTVGKYTVSYNSNGGVCTTTEQIKAYNTNLILSESVPTRDGYNFLGWSTDENATVAEYLPGDTYSQNADITLYAVWEKIAVKSITAKVAVTSYENDSETIEIKFTKSDETAPLYSMTVTGNSAECSFDDVEIGEYVLTVSKADHVIREYEVVIDENGLNFDAEIHLVGDINGDGKVNTLDVARANAHAKGVTEAAGYEFDCADVNGDGNVNTIDVARMNAHAKGVSALW